MSAPSPDEVVAELARASGLPAGVSAAAHAAWDGFVTTARRDHADLAFDERALATFVGERLTGTDIATALAEVPAADLALVAACAHGDPAAHAAFDRVLSEVDIAGAAVGASKDVIQDVKQVLRVQLLVAKDGKPAGITGYRGRGPLRGWLRITATRELIRHKKKLARELPLEQGLDQLLTTRIDPALEALKAEYRSEFAASLREAITDLSVEDRTLLVHQIVHGASIDEVGAAFGVHRATAARWLTRARAALVAATHRRLAVRLKLPVSEMESVIKLVQSQLDASMIRYLSEPEA